MTTVTAAARPGLVSPVAPIASVAWHHGLDLAAVRLTDGPLAAWQQLNAAATIPHCIAQLEVSGVLDNFRRVVGESSAAFRGFWFADSDLYKVIEAVAWEIARTGTAEFDGWLDDVIALVARTAEPSGYVHTYIQGVAPDKKFVKLEMTHEMYVLGHMVQAGVALSRANGRGDLLELARAFCDLVDRRFGPGREDGICGHPEIETALVELYRHTGEERYLRLAERMVDLRGHGLLPVGGLGARYFQDHAPVREATSAVGHAVRQLYLNAGVTDVYLETGDPTLLTAMDAQWASAHERKMFLSGAFGSRHRDEAFGDDYELPSERAYAETCATIADLHWTWRMLLAGAAAGAATFAETIEREIHNALAASIDASGTRFFYSNPLQQRPDRYSEENAPRTRTEWYVCACCPPNIARTVAQLSCYVASTTADTLWLHLIAGAEIDLPEHLGDGVVRVETAYPVDGAVRISVHGQVAEGARLAVRIPSWSRGSELRGDDGAAAAVQADGYAVLPLVAGATYELDLDLTPRFTRAHHRVDAVRGTLAIERGPLVYCVEQADLDADGPGGVEVDDLVLVPGAAITPGDGAALTVACAVVVADDGLYETAGTRSTAAGELAITAIPFATWGNRAPGPMRVWIPVQTL